MSMSSSKIIKVLEKVFILAELGAFLLFSLATARLRERKRVRYFYVRKTCLDMKALNLKLDGVEDSIRSRSFGKTMLFQPILDNRNLP